MFQKHTFEENSLKFYQQIPFPRLGIMHKGFKAENQKSAQYCPFKAPVETEVLLLTLSPHSLMSWGKKCVRVASAIVSFWLHAVALAFHLQR